jgi:hypothetical protein
MFSFSFFVGRAKVVLEVGGEIALLFISPSDSLFIRCWGRGEVGCFIQPGRIIATKLTIITLALLPFRKYLPIMLSLGSRPR